MEPRYDVKFDPDPNDPNPHAWVWWGVPMRCPRGDTAEVEELFRLEFEGSEVPPFVIVEVE